MMSAQGPFAGFWSVSIGPGCTRLTVIPCGPRSRASPRVNASIADFVIEFIAELAQLLLALTAADFEALPFLLLRQAVTAFEQFGRAAEEAAVGEDLFECGAGLVQARITGGAAGEVAALEFVLGQ